MTDECHCIVTRSTTGLVWTAQTPDRTCPPKQHRHGQPWRDETRGDA